MKVKIKIFLFVLIISQLCECVRIRKRNKSRSIRQNYTSEIPISQPPELIEIIELETVTLPSDDIASPPVTESKKSIVNDDIKSLIQTLKNVMQKKENSSSAKNLITTTKKPTRNAHEMKKVHSDAPVKKAFMEKKQILAKSIVDAPRYMELDCKFGNLSD
jgi:hypothetical protein